MLQLEKNPLLRYFHISKKNLHGKTLYPRVPSNELTGDGKEDNFTERVCMSPFIEGCLRSISIEIIGEYNIYTNSSPITKVHIPTEDEVADAKLTGEVWVLEPVTLAYYGRLTITTRVDTAPAFGYLKDDKLIEVANHSYFIEAKSCYVDGLSIEAIDQDGELPEYLAKLVPQDYLDIKDTEVKEF